MRPRLPLTVVSGYLGAGKTTLINRLLAEPHGLRLLVMVNDFGAINIDAALLAEAGTDTLTLTNGCVCCTMGADLFMAIGDVLDRSDRPDHLIIEASGVADPARIAQVAHAEPDLAYGGIITLADGPGFAALADDPQIGSQVEEQVRAADLVCVSKLVEDDPWLMLRLKILCGGEVADLRSLPQLAPVLLAGGERLLPALPAARHPGYLGWQFQGDLRLEEAPLRTLLEARPEGLFRFKGFVGRDVARAWEVHVVGRKISVTPLSGARQTQVVGIGLSDRVSLAEIDAWWKDARAEG